MEINAGWSDTNITDWYGSAVTSYRAFAQRKFLCLAGLFVLLADTLVRWAIASG